MPGLVYVKFASLYLSKLRDLRILRCIESYNAFKLYAYMRACCTTSVLFASAYLPDKFSNSLVRKTNEIVSLLTYTAYYNHRNK